MSRLALGVLVTAIAYGGACAPGGGRVGLPEAMELSDKTLDALDDAFGAWRVASVDPQSVACLDDANALPPVVRGDFNSDGRPDVALALESDDGVLLVVVLERVNESMAIEVDRLGLEMADGSLAVEPQGTPFIDPGGLEDYFSADTLALRRCGQPRTVYFWSGLDFRKQTLDSGSAPAGGGSLHLPQHPL